MVNKERLKLICERCIEVESRNKKYIRYFSFLLKSPRSKIETMRTFNGVKISGIIWLTVHDKPVNKDKTKMIKRIVQFEMSSNKTSRNLKIRKEAI